MKSRALGALRALIGPDKQPAASPDLHLLVQQLERCLKENVADFWYPRCIDSANGGYQLGFDQTGVRLRPSQKALVTQARTLWLFSRLARYGYRSDDMLAAAKHGFEYLRDRMWDGKHGGFYWSVDAASGKKRAANKHLYAQAFGLFALSEYALASSASAPLDLGAELLQLIESRTHDDANGGYREYFREDWSPPPKRQPAYVGGASDLKLMNTHLHLLEAMTAYHRVQPTGLSEARLRELLQVQTTAVIRHQFSAYTDRHAQDWTPLLDRDSARVSFGHDLEAITMVANACEALQLPVSPLLGLLGRVFAYSYRHGFDNTDGGFFESGPLGEVADRHNKIWWVQAEAMLSALVLRRLTGDQKYFEVFEKTWSYIQAHQVDWAKGEWHHTVSPDGHVSGSKGSEWKAGYHTGRCLIESIETLRALVHGA